jgi:hypothetical protein
MRLMIQICIAQVLVSNISEDNGNLCPNIKRFFQSLQANFITLLQDGT